MDWDMGMAFAVRGVRAESPRAPRSKIGSLSFMEETCPLRQN